MDELIHYLSLDIQNNPDLAAAQYMYIQKCCENPEFPKALLEIFQNLTLSLSIQSNALSSLKMFCSNREKEFSAESIIHIFNCLHSFILRGHPLSQEFSYFLIKMAQNLPNVKAFFFPMIFDMLPSFLTSDFQSSFIKLNSISLLLSFLCKKSPSSDEASEEFINLFHQLIEKLLFFCSNFNLFQTIDHFNFLKRIMKCISHLFRRTIPKDLQLSELASFLPLFAFIKSLLSNFVSNFNPEIENFNLSVPPQFIAFSTKYLTSFFQKKKFLSIPEIAEIKQEFLSLIIQALPAALTLDHLQPPITYVLYKFLSCLYNDYTHKDIIPNSSPELLQLFISASELNSSDLEDAEMNPYVFYSTIYEVDLEIGFHVRKLAREIVYSLATFRMNKNPEEEEEPTEPIEPNPLAVVLLSSNPLEASEGLIRCISFCLKGFIKMGLGNEAHNWVYGLLEQFLQVMSQGIPDPVNISTRLELLKRAINLNLLSIDEIQAFSDLISAILSNKSEMMLPSIFACKLVAAFSKKKIILPQGITEQIVAFTPECPTKHASKALKIIADNFPDLIIPQAEGIIQHKLEFLITQIIPTIFSDNIDEDDDSIEHAEQYFREDIEMIEHLILMAKESVISPELIAFVSNLFQCSGNKDDGEYFDQIIPLCSAIAISGNGPAQMITEMIFSFIQQSPLSQMFIGTLIQPFLALLSLKPDTYKILNISQHLCELALEVIQKFDESDDFDQENAILPLGDLVQWICLIDTQFDSSLILQIASSNEDNPLKAKIKICWMCAIFLAHGSISDQESFAKIAEFASNPQLLRTSDKLLFSAVLLLPFQNPGFDLLSNLNYFELVYKLKKIATAEMEGKLKLQLDEDLEEPIRAMLIENIYKSPIFNYPLAQKIQEIVSRLPQDYIAQMDSN